MPHRAGANSAVTISGTSICDMEPVSTRLKLAAWALFAVVVVLNLVAAYYSIVTRSYPYYSELGTWFLDPWAWIDHLHVSSGGRGDRASPAGERDRVAGGLGFVWGLESVLSGYATDVISFNHGSREIAGYAAAVDGTLWLPGVGLIGTFLILLFPDGHLPSPGWRWVGGWRGLRLLLGRW